MRLKLKTKVIGDITKVYHYFNSELFLYVSIPIIRMNVTRFDGTNVGDEIHFKFKSLFFQMFWVSRITSHERLMGKIEFIDQGVKLPIFMKSWQHRHIIEGLGNYSLIIDDVTFKPGVWVIAPFVWIAIFVMFYYRKPRYKRYYRDKENLNI